MLSKNEQDEIIKSSYHLIYEYCLLRLKYKDAALDVTQDNNGCCFLMKSVIFLTV